LNESELGFVTGEGITRFPAGIARESNKTHKDITVTDEIFSSLIRSNIFLFQKKYFGGRIFEF